jgi:enamine deaminase RidA (YjgF/YER057c/UK114 family)
MMIKKAGGKSMSQLKRYSVNTGYALSHMVEAGDFVFLNFCVGNVGQSFEEQVHGALNDMERCLEQVNLTLEAVVKIDVLLRDAWNIPIMEKVFKERFLGSYPARKTIETNFAHIGGAEGLHIQIDGIAYKK